MSVCLTTTVPRLLVSVRDVAEARAAIAGGCNILDIKDPANGSLGMAGAQQIREIVSTCDELPVSAALGETRDWTASRPVPGLPGKLAFCKLGTAGLNIDVNWRDQWLKVRRRFEKKSARPLDWIAVAYADWHRAAAPCPRDVLAAAVATRCAGLLIDTFHKDCRSSLWALNDDEVRGLLDDAKAAGLLTALAGLSSRDDFTAAASLVPDVIAVRTLACEDGRRNRPVSSTAVARLRELLVVPPIRRDAVSL